MNGADAHGNYHGPDGRFVDLQTHMDRIFAEKEKATEFARLTLEKTVAAAAAATKEAMQDAKAAADARNEVLENRIKTLESGGAPFASRLDESLTRLKTDVDALKIQSAKLLRLDDFGRAHEALEAKVRGLEQAQLADQQLHGETVPAFRQVQTAIDEYGDRLDRLEDAETRRLAEEAARKEDLKRLTAQRITGRRWVIGLVATAAVFIVVALVNLVINLSQGVP